ncbi:MAG: hypothetical protein EP335_11190 [Alphaproteobacteria bacterium]|nr:MAG: hypothetical protein EP335_11190 [Alphaproteobacteria bacterium]
MKKVILGLMMLVWSSQPAFAQLAVVIELPVSEQEAMQVVEDILGMRPLALDMSNVRKVRYSDRRPVIEVDINTTPFLQDKGTCVRRTIHLSKPDGETDIGELQNRPDHFRVDMYAAELPPTEGACADVTHWIQLGPGLDYAGGVIGFLPKLRAWMASVSKEDFCAALIDAELYCDQAFTAIRAQADLTTLNHAEHFEGVPVRGESSGGVQFSFRVSSDATLVFTVLPSDNSDVLFSRVAVTWIYA